MPPRFVPRPGVSMINVDQRPAAVLRYKHSLLVNVNIIVVIGERTNRCRLLDFGIVLLPDRASDNVEEVFPRG